jgi:hypothetical protein
MFQEDVNMKPNEEMVKKAVITADALAAQGKLNPVQSDKFIDYIVDQTMLKDNARVVRFRNEQMDIDKIGLGKRAAMPAAEAQDPGTRRGVNTSKITLQPKEIIVPFEIGDTFREINIEGDSIDDHIAKMMATQAANDIEEMYISGDVLGPAIKEADYIDNGHPTNVVKDGLWALMDGWLRAADGGHVVDLENGNIGTSHFGKMIRALPTKWRRNMMDLRWFMSSDLAQLYAEKLAARGTALGDVVTKEGFGKSSVPIFGVMPLPAPLLPFWPKVVEHVTLTGTSTVTLRYKPIMQTPSEVVTLATLAGQPTIPFVEGSGNDYVMDYVNGTITRDAASTISSGSLCKVTYYAKPQMMLTHKNNFIIAIGRDIRIEKDRDIFKRVNQYAITIKVDVQVEEDDALVKGKNCGDS